LKKVRTVIKYSTCEYVVDLYHLARAHKAFKNQDQEPWCLVISRYALTGKYARLINILLQSKCTPTKQYNTIKMHAK